MITKYSIDILYPRIQDSRTKEYFDEVLSCFYSGNHRSAVVMLYSVTICDLIFKLQRLKDIYNDQTSIDILNRIEAIQDGNPKSPDWENSLREELLRNKRILNSSSFTHLENLQKERHLCAHPILKGNVELFRPNKISVEAHIVNMLADILTLPPFLEKELLGEILTDIDRQRRNLSRKTILEDYLSSRYLDKIKSPEIEGRLFIHLWKIVFLLSNDECDRNRMKNFWFLRLLLTRNHRDILSLSQKESERLSRQVDVNNITILELFVKLMNEFHEIYPMLEESFKISLEAKIKATYLLANISFFLHEDFLAHYQTLKSRIAEDDDWQYIIEFTEKKLNKEAALSLLIAIFSRSESFNDASNNFNHFIKPFLDQFTLQNLIEVLDAINNNKQIEYSWNVQKYFKEIEDRVVKIHTDFDFSPYGFLT